MKEASDEVLLERDVIDPVVDRLLIDIATEALIEHDTEVKENETQQVMLYLLYKKLNESLK